MNKDLDLTPEAIASPENTEDIVLADDFSSMNNSAAEASEATEAPKAEEAPPLTADIYYKTREFKGAESVFAWICMLVGYLFCRMFPAVDAPLGMLITVAVALVSTTVVLAKKGAIFNGYSIFAAFSSLVFAVSLLFADSELISLIALLSSVYSYFYFVYSATGNRAEKGITNVIPLDIIRAAFVFPFVSFGKLFPAMFSRKSKSHHGVFKVLLGLAIAFIPTLIIIAFLSYDEAFAELFTDILDFIDDFNIFSHLGSLILGMFIAMYIFGLYVTSTNEDRPYAITSADCEKVYKHVRFVPALTVAAALTPILSVYVIFFISQWKYYVSAFTGVLPEGVASYAEYARSGFFELCAVSVINFIIIVVVALFLRREKKGDYVFLRLANVTVSVMTLVLIGTAMAKMWLYINEFGLTEKRVLSSWFMIVLAIIYLAIILGQIIPKMKLVAVSLFVITVMTAALSFVNHPALIANYNVDLYIDGKTDEIDVATIYSLGDSAVPALVDLVEFWENGDLTTDQENDKALHYERLVGKLKASSNRLDREKTIFSFSLPSYRAEQALNDYFD